jgi:hypothetical protein
MKIQNLILAGTLALGSLAIANAKTYDIILTAPTHAGTVQLAPGEYKLKVAGTTATFTNIKSDKSVTAPVKVQQAAKKFDVTAVDTAKQNGEEQIQSIELGGSNNKLEF